MHKIDVRSEKIQTLKHILTLQEVIRVLNIWGFKKISQKGSHAKYINTEIAIEEFIKYL